MALVDLTPQFFFQWHCNLGIFEQWLCVVTLLLGYAHDRFFIVLLVAANTARDLGGRLVAIFIWGTRANGGSYAAIAALTNIIATVAAYAFYEFTFKDSSRGNVAQNHHSPFSWT
jgi:hypothetical protein